jgi:hypothetical protein
VSTQFVFVVNHPVTSIWESISRVKSAAVCSKVLDLLRTQSPLVALPASLERRSADSAETVLATREGVAAGSSTSRPSTSQESAGGDLGQAVEEVRRLASPPESFGTPF